jgi:hypothetical protein
MVFGRWMLGEEREFLGENDLVRHRHATASKSSSLLRATVRSA